jgi:hypothetical protein
LIFDTIPDEFRTAWMHVEMIDDVSSYGLYYLKIDNRIQALYDDLDEVVKKFRGLRNRFKNTGYEAWAGATFIVNLTNNRTSRSSPQACRQPYASGQGKWQQSRQKY